MFCFSLLVSDSTRSNPLHQATQDRKWADISRKIGSSQPFSHQIRMVYNRVILPFEQYAARAKSTQSPPKPSNSSVVAPIPVPSASLPSAFASTPMGKLSNSQFPPTPSSRPHRGSGQKKVYDEDGESSLSEPDSDTDADLSRPVFAPPLGSFRSISRVTCLVLKLSFSWSFDWQSSFLKKTYL